MEEDRKYSKEDMEAEERRLSAILNRKPTDHYEIEVLKHYPNISPDVINYVGGYKQFMWLSAEDKEIFAKGGWVDIHSSISGDDYGYSGE